MKKFSYIEIILALSFLFMFVGVLYSFSQESTLQETKKNIIATEKEIIETVNLKKSWEGKKVDSKVRNLKTLLPSRTVREYKISRRKAQIKLSNVDIKIMNRFMVKLSSLPVQFITLNLKNSGDKYNMECRCKW